MTKLGLDDVLYIRLPLGVRALARSEAARLGVREADVIRMFLKPGLEAASKKAATRAMKAAASTKAEPAG